MEPADDTIVRAHALIRGRVQGVYFRASTADEARALGLSGWVRNAGDEVEAVFEGTRPRVERILAWCHEGPAHASVEAVEVTWGQPEGLRGFGIRY